MNEETTNETIEEAVENEEVTETVTEEATSEAPVAEDTSDDNTDDDDSLFDATSWIDGFASTDSEEDVQEREEAARTLEEPEAAEEVKEEVVEAPPVADDLNRPDVPEREMSVWERFAQDVGIQANDYGELIHKIKSQDTVVREDEYLNRIGKLYIMGDEELYKSFLSVKIDQKGPDGEIRWTKDKIDRRVNLAKEKGEIEFLADEIRDDLVAKKQQYLEGIKKKEQSEVAKRQTDTDNFTQSLQSNVSKTKDLYEGVYNFTDSDKEEVMDFIMNGNFQQAIVQDVGTLIEVAHFVKNREKILKLMKSNGQAEGTRSTLEKIRPVASNRKSFALPDKSSSPYLDANKFLAGLDKTKS